MCLVAVLRFYRCFIYIYIYIYIYMCLCRCPADCLLERKLDKEKGSPRSPCFVRLARRPAYLKGSSTRRKGRLARLASFGSLRALPL